MAQISIIIPAWNLWETTLQCLESIASTTDNELLQHIEVLVIDNGSSDKTVQALTPTLARFFGMHGKALIMPQNLGFAKACNIGAKAASAPLLFFLNNDTILTQNCLPPLLQHMQSSAQLGMVGPLLLYPGDKVQHAGICFSPILELMYCYHLLSKNSPLVHKARSWQAITGAAMLMPATLFADCGGFYEGYINGFEDIDLCCQVRQKGLQLQVVSKSIIYHSTSQTPGRFDFDSENSALLSTRFSGAFYPDQHRIALDDGLLPMFSPDLELYISVPEAKNKALSHIVTENFTPQRCLDFLQKEPFWLHGYSLLAAHLEKNGQWHEALDYRLQAAQLAPLRENFFTLAKCAAKTGQADILQSAEQCLQDILTKTQNSEGLQQKLTAIRALAQKHNDSALVHICEQWIDTNR